MTDSCNCANASVALNSLATNLTIDGEAVTFVEGPSTRGTVDIVFLCVSTIVLATWSSVCLNVPATEEGLLWKLWRQFYWTIFAIQCPDFVMLSAYGQFKAARAAVKDYMNDRENDRRLPEWTLTHAFFADMGGIELRPDNFHPFRVNSKHIKYLVTQGYLTPPELSVEDIKDKSKKSNLTRLVATLQILYVIVQCFERISKRSQITILEQYALEIITFSFFTSFWWWRKPADVDVPISIRVQFDVHEIRRKADKCEGYDWPQHPLDFVDDLNPSWSLQLESFLELHLGHSSHRFSKCCVLLLKMLPLIADRERSNPELGVDRSTLVLRRFFVAFRHTYIRLVSNVPFNNRTTCLEDCQRQRLVYRLFLLGHNNNTKHCDPYIIYDIRNRRNRQCSTQRRNRKCDSQIAHFGPE